MNLNFSFLSKYWPMFVRGAGTTLILSFFTVLIGLIIGVLLALLRLGKFKPLSFLSAAYTEFIRGTPLMVQIFFIFYALPQMGFKIPNITGLGFDFPRFASGILAMGLNSGAYVGEIVRAGIPCAAWCCPRPSKTYSPRWATNLSPSSRNLPS